MWFPGETVNFGIGQGYLNVTPLQMAHYVSVLASRGKVWKPRLVTGFRDALSGKLQALPPLKEPDVTLATAEQWDRIYTGMIGAVTHGTAALAVGKNLAYSAAGKTGTAQVFSVGQNEKYNEKTVSERLRDHSWFIAFAPVEKPRIALAVIVENGGWGASAAAPIARKVLDSYLLGDDGKLKADPNIGTSILPTAQPVDAPTVKPSPAAPDQKRAISPAQSNEQAG
jgi:penicillin-binding protein 2